jgi:hypothetical protein
VSWSNWDIQLKSVALSQIVEQCGSALSNAEETSFSALNLAAAIDSKGNIYDFGQKTLDHMPKLSSSIVRLQLVLAADNTLPPNSLVSNLGVLSKGTDRIERGTVDGAAMRLFAKKYK